MSVRYHPPGAPAARASLVASLLERWRLILGAALLAAVTTFAIRTLATKRRYKAEAVLAAVSSQKVPAGLGSLAGLTGLAAAATGAGGILATPDVVADLLTSRKVLVEVGLTPMPGGPKDVLIIDRVLNQPGARPPLATLVRRLRGILSVQVDKRTGFVVLAVAHEDSAVARAVAARVAAVAGRALADVMRSQASAQRRGLEVRVDSMASWLRGAEDRLAELQSENRVIAGFSGVGLTQQRLTREISVAQQAYLQAVTEREAAVARELEQTPALLVVDPVPSELEMLPRYAAFFALAAAVGATFLVITGIFLRESVVRLRTATDPDAARLRSAVEGVPVARRWLVAPDGAAR